MISKEFIYGLLSGVIATGIGFGFAVVWDLWKDKKREGREKAAAIQLLREEIAANIQIVDQNREILGKDMQALKEKKEVVLPLSLIQVQGWESARLAGRLGKLPPEIVKELNLTYMRALILNQKIQGRELYRLTNQAMSNYANRRGIINQDLVAASEDLLNRFGSHSRDFNKIE